MVDRESARELLAAKLEQGAKHADPESAAPKAADKKPSKKPTRGQPSRSEKAGGVVKDVVKSSAFKQFLRTAASEVARGMFGTARRR